MLLVAINSLEVDRELTAEQHLLRNVLPFMQQRLQLGQHAVGLSGISMGGQGGCGWRSSIRDIPRRGRHRLVARLLRADTTTTPPPDMYDSKEQCRQDPDLARTADGSTRCIVSIPMIDGCGHRLHEKLTALGVAHERDLTDRGRRGLGNLT